MPQRRGSILPMVVLPMVETFRDICAFHLCWADYPHLRQQHVRGWWSSNLEVQELPCSPLRRAAYMPSLSAWSELASLRRAGVWGLVALAHGVATCAAYASPIAGIKTARTLGYSALIVGGLVHCAGPATG